MRQFQVGMGVDQTRHEHGVGMVKDFRTRITAGDFPEPVDPNNFSCLHC
jgi:adenylosuccinate synthase